MTTSQWPQGIAAITLFVEDLEASTAFYARTFDLPIHHQDDVSAIFKFGGSMINLLHIGQADELVRPAKVAGQESGVRAVYTLLVDDVDAKCAELTARGVTLLSGPIDRPWGIRTASFADPAGHIWEITRWG